MNFEQFLIFSVEVATFFCIFAWFINYAKCIFLNSI